MDCKIISKQTSSLHLQLLPEKVLKNLSHVGISCSVSTHLSFCLHICFNKMPIHTTCLFILTFFRIFFVSFLSKTVFFCQNKVVSLNFGLNGYSTLANCPHCVFLENKTENAMSRIEIHHIMVHLPTKALNK